MNQRGIAIVPVIAIVFAVACVGLGGWMFMKVQNTNQQVACTADAKLCPDGSYVGRTGSKCEFTTCPATNTTNSGTNSNTNTAANLNTNSNTAEDFYVQFIDAQTSQAIAHAEIEVFSDNGVRCIQEPCLTNGRTWKGKTDSQGKVVIPASMNDGAVSLSLVGYQADYLQVGYYLNQRDQRQANGSFIVTLKRREGS